MYVCVFIWIDPKVTRGKGLGVYIWGLFFNRPFRQYYNHGSMATQFDLVLGSTPYSRSCLSYNAMEDLLGHPRILLPHQGTFESIALTF